MATTRVSPSKIALNDDETIRLDDSGKTRAYFCRREPSRVDRSVIAQLKAAAKELGNRNVRLCLHSGPDAAFHQMLILEHPNRYARPHKHSRKGEAYHLIEGSMGIFIFDEAGAIQDACRLSAEETFLYRVGMGMYHTNLPLTDIVIYHECKPGPFTGEGDSVWAPWSPDGTDAAAVEAFRSGLFNTLEGR